MNLSFAGCGFLGIYHVGVAVCFKKYAPHLLLEKIGGASAGSLAACCLLCDLPLGKSLPPACMGGSKGVFGGETTPVGMKGWKSIKLFVQNH